MKGDASANVEPEKSNEIQQKKDDENINDIKLKDELSGQIQEKIGKPPPNKDRNVKEEINQQEPMQSSHHDEISTENKNNDKKDELYAKQVNQEQNPTGPKPAECTEKTVKKSIDTRPEDEPHDPFIDQAKHRMILSMSLKTLLASRIKATVEFPSRNEKLAKDESFKQLIRILFERLIPNFIRKSPSIQSLSEVHSLVFLLMKKIDQSF